MTSDCPIPKYLTFRSIRGKKREQVNVMLCSRLDRDGDFTNVIIEEEGTAHPQNACGIKISRFIIVIIIMMVLLLSIHQNVLVYRSYFIPLFFPPPREANCVGLARPVKTHQGQGQVPGQQTQVLRTPATPPQMTPHGPMVLQTSIVPETEVLASHTHPHGLPRA